MLTSHLLSFLLTILMLLLMSGVNGDGGSSSSSGGDGDPATSNIAALVGAVCGMTFLVTFYFFLERKYPNADIAFQ